MTDHSNDRKDRPRAARGAFLRLFSGEGAALRRLHLRTFLSIAIERLWPLVLPLILLLALFASLGWLGLFALMPRWLHMGVLAVFSLAGLVALYLPFRFRPPREEEIVARIEAVNGLVHEPLAVQTGTMATGTHDPFAIALWREHQKRMAERLKNLQSGLPRPRVPERDPFGLRAGVALLFVTAFAYSLGSTSGRIADAFNLPPAKGSAVARIDAWVTPPRYTGRAPIFLTAGSENRKAADPITVPQGSIVSVRVIGGSAERLTATDAEGKRREINPLPPDKARRPKKARSIVVSMAAVISATIFRKMKRWRFRASMRAGSSS